MKKHIIVTLVLVALLSGFLGFFIDRYSNWNLIALCSVVKSWSWDPASVSAFVASLALVLNAYVTMTTRKSNAKQSFENLFFQLLQLLLRVLEAFNLRNKGVTEEQKLLEKFKYQNTKKLLTKRTDYFNTKEVADYAEKVIKENDCQIAIDKFKNIKGRVTEDEFDKTYRVFFCANSERIQKQEIVPKGLDIAGNKIKLSSVDKDEIVESAIDFNKYGKFFRTVHRIVKLLLERSADEQQKYIGILRTQLSEEQLILLYYNAEYTQRGKKFKENVKDMNLWGDRKELELTPPMHFNNELLVWSDDLDILKKDYTNS
ncbi:hypothetical protein Nizo2814_1798 [Lactiplantibacillus plantarum]|uniref:putative phage abortive infection protein n=1 Tax=Lactiplantibacillus plantarum TaxID=1590 RepID=UPI0007BB95F6|nr:putative phage abortive infection protein [Lactiplantibacillus plantarum]KZU62669.1 hypothetical protein Nizo2814_1798 [Lactiplantibacillus plantarum]